MQFQEQNLELLHIVEIFLKSNIISNTSLNVESMLDHTLTLAYLSNDIFDKSLFNEAMFSHY